MIPNTKISQTILEFGSPLISQLPADYTREEFETAISIIITAWNAVVLDQWEKGDRNEKQLLSTMQSAPKEAQLEVKRLIKRKKKKFGSDPRGVGNHWIREENGEHIFGCEARLNVENEPTDKMKH